jgi:hypothetical protein
MDWLLEIVKWIFGGIFDLARRATLRDESRPKWLRNCFVGSYYVLPTLLLFSVFLSWKIAVIILGVFILSLIVGAATEADDPRYQ